MTQISRILVAVDFSTPARRAFDHALALSQQHEAPLTVIQAVPLDQTFNSDGRERHALAVELRQKAEAEGVDLTYRVQHGDPAKVILLHARSLRPDLILVGTHQRRGLDRMRAGSVGERVAAKARAPVLVVPDAATSAHGSFRQILSAVDFSEASVSALSVAVGLAQQSGGHLRALHVLGGFPNETVYSGSRAFRLLDDFHARVGRVNRELEALIPADARHWSEIEVATVSGRPHEAILGAAAERSTDVIVLGSSRRSRLDQMVVGSTARRVLRRATSPVLLVPGPSRDLPLPRGSAASIAEWQGSPA